MTDKPTFIDLFCGSGGLSLGFEWAGWKCLLSTDFWEDAIRTYNDNRHNGDVAIEADILHITDKKLSSYIPEKPQWVIGGPPCQGFSTVGKRQRSDPRNTLIHEFHRIVKSLHPEGFLIENVIGLKDMKFEPAVIRLFEKIGYNVSSMVLRAADHGVPQLRRRIIFVGHRDRGFFSGPMPTHKAHDYVNVWDAIGDLPELGPGETVTEYDKEPFTDYQRKMREGSTSLQGHTSSAHPPHLIKAISYIPDGGNRKSIPPKYQPKSGYHNCYSRLYSKAPAVAVTSNMGKPSGTRCIHPFQNRGLSAREGARLQSFPDVYHFCGGIVSQRLQIANAVPPILAKSIAQGLEDDDNWLKYKQNSLEAYANNCKH